MWRVHLQVDRLPIDALVVSCYPRCLCLNLAPDLREIIKPLPRNMQELSPFLLSCYAGGCVRHVNLVCVVGVFSFAWEIDKLENKRSPCYNATASRKEVPADDVLED